MTAQYNDNIRHAGEFYELVGISAKNSSRELFDPEKFGIKTYSNTTACWRGYLAGYGLRDNRLVLEELRINVKDPEWEEELKRLRELKEIRRALPPSRRGPKQQARPRKPGPYGPAIHGVLPRPSFASSFHAGFSENYSNIGLPLPFTGGLLLGKGFIHKLYRHMGFHPAWKYEKVVELIFAKGVLTATHDRSAEMANVREANAAAEKQAESHFNSPIELIGWIENCFDRSY